MVRVVRARQNELRHGVYLFAAASINISIDIFLPFAHSDVFLVWAERIWHYRYQVYTLVVGSGSMKNRTHLAEKITILFNQLNDNSQD